MEMKKLLSIVDSSGTTKQESLTENQIKSISTTEKYFNTVNNEVLTALNEEQLQKSSEVKQVANRVLEKLNEGKTKTQPAKPRNFVAKNAINSGAGQHKDKKKAEKQGDIKHKKDLVPMDEERTEVKDKDGNVTSWKDEGEWKKSTAKKDGRGKVTNLSDKARRETEKLSKKEKELTEGTWDDEDFRNRERNAGLEDERNNIAIAINGKTWKVVRGKGYADSPEERQYLNHMRDWAERKSASSGKKWSVHLTGAEPTNESLAESEYGSVEVGSPVKVYSNVLKKTVFGKVVKLHEGKAHVQYNNTKIVMRHPVNEVAAAPVAATVAKAAPGVAGKMASRLVPGLGLAVSGYDAYDRAKKGDYAGAALSGAAGLASLIPGVGTAATIGLTGAQLARDYKKGTGAFAPDEPAQAATPAAKYPTTAAEIKAFQTANKLTPDGIIGPKTQAALTAAGLKKPAVAQTATPAPASNLATAARTVAPAASAVAQQVLRK